ncbi:FecR family protein [Spirosoma sp. KUDC1026]|uniref:FecR family protein n=1 Tax=Spirosoma sp. KUDC1026 TaxID=2745947 RepID=UPI00159BB3C5|nr:FecR family protein [Spirosoma sp. KUDC1026]QKZ12119.1 FecR domain-containing protein [Spirosoma sp. KUDC1026]
MSQYEFDQLLQKYLAGGCEPAEEKLIADWCERTDGQLPTSIDNREQDAIRQRLWTRLSSTINGKPRRRPLFFQKRGLGIVCGLFLLVGIGFWVRNTSTSEPPLLTQFTLSGGNREVCNTGKQPQTIWLEEGTMVTLQPKAVLNYPVHFARQDRTVFLKGEAFFNVKRNPAKPFIVHTGELVTEVLGTSFRIKASEDAKEIEVAVVTGRVAVYQMSDREVKQRKEVILKPNQKIDFDSRRKQLIPSLVDHPTRLIAKRQPVQLVFEAVPLQDVLTQLQAIYGIDIFLENDVLTACVLTADLTDLPLYKQLELICRSLNADYETRGTSIFIRGVGCQ